MAVDTDFWEHIWDELEPQDLPGDLELLAMDLGMDATRRLTEYVRGRLYVPSQQGSGGTNLFGDEHEGGIPSQLEHVAEEVGQDVAQYLAQAWDGTDLYIPTPDAVVRVYRNRHLHEDVRRADSVEEVAEQYDISTRRVLQLLESRGQQGTLWSEKHSG